MDHHPHTATSATTAAEPPSRPGGRRCGRRARLAVASLAALGVLGGLGQPASASEAGTAADATVSVDATASADLTADDAQAAEGAQVAEGAQATPIPPVARPASLLHELDGTPLDRVTLAGSHNTYQKRGCNPLDARCSAEEQSRTFHYLYDGFASAQAIEIDVFTTFGWKVNHDGPGSNENNCPEAGVNGNTRNQDLRSCIEGLRTWHEANPDHPLQIVKLELKDGFRSGRSPAELDELIANVSGRGSKTRIPRNWIFTPDDLRCATGTCFATPDEAARAGAWPAMGQLRGKFMFVIINGVSDSTMAQVGAAVFGVQDGSVQYARALAAGQAHLVFPSMLLKSPANGDVRPGRYPGDSARWVVVFDMELDRMLPGGQTVFAQAMAGWMASNHFLRFTTVSKPTLVETFGPIGGPTGSIARGNAVLAKVRELLGSNVIDTDQEKLGLTFR